MPTRLVLRSEIEQPVSVLRGLEPLLAPFHWEIEFPEVFLETGPDGSIRRRADGRVRRRSSATRRSRARTRSPRGIVPAYLDWLKTVHPESHGNADLVAHFFRRAFNLIRPEGTFGLIATNTIGQGDTARPACAGSATTAARSTRPASGSGGRARRRSS